MEEKNNRKKITNIDDYINEIKLMVDKAENDTVVVYRGENVYYPTHCQPNLFRNNYFQQNKFFERNLLDEMKSNKLTKGSTYLEIAVDAQHGGFPSRLLDVTYNSLVSLYFAVTPSLKKEEYENDGKDGYVYVYYIQNLFCPSAQNINKLFDSIVNRDQSWLCENPIFQRNHKLIDHIKINNRIIAQQGAFILFQGDEVSHIQESDYDTIVIDSKSKSRIRRDLKRFFGIHSGSIYPEAENLVIDIESKSSRISNNEFSFDNELELYINNLIREVNYLKGLIIDCSFENKCNSKLEDKIMKTILSIEKSIYYYKEELKELRDMEIDTNDKELKESKNKIRITIQEYNQIIEELINFIIRVIKELKFEIEINLNSFKI